MNHDERCKWLGLAGHPMRDLSPWSGTPPLQRLEAPWVGPAIPDGTDPLGQFRFKGCVWSDHASTDPMAVHFISAARALVPAPPPPEKPVLELPGTWLFGGGLQAHFGHFLTESLGRLWALDLAEANAVSGIIWVPLFEGPPPAFVPATLAAMRGLPQALVLEEQVLRPERLLVPRQEVGSGFGLLPRPDAVHSLRERFASAHTAKAPTGAAVYVTRSALQSSPTWIANGSGQLLPGTLLDEAFRQGGYRVFHPELTDVAQQIQTYRSADVLVVDEGSALHLIALVARPETRIVVLCRRPHYRFLLEAHLRIYLGDAARVTARMVEGTALDVGTPNPAFIVPDMKRLATILSEAGVPAIPTEQSPAESLELALAYLQRGKGQ